MAKRIFLEKYIFNNEKNNKMLIAYILVLYLIIINLSFINKRKYSKLYLETRWHFFKSLISVLIFVIYFVIYIRLMSLFREHKILDLKYFFFNYDLKMLLLVLILLYFFRKNLIFFVKIDCYRLHYYFMNNQIESNLLKPYYNTVFNKYFSLIIYYIYPILYYINIVITTITYSMVAYDLYINNCILYTSLLIIPYYSLFKLLYNIICYFELKHHALYEYFVRNHNYMLFLKSKNIISDFSFDAKAHYLEYEKKVIREIKK